MYFSRVRCGMIQASRRMQNRKGKRGNRLAAAALILMMLLSVAWSAMADTVTYRGVTVDQETEYVDLGRLSIYDWDGLIAFLQKLPNLKQVDMYNAVPGVQTIRRLNTLFPEVTFGCQLRVGERQTRTDATAFSTLYYGEGARLASYDQVASLAWCKNLYALDIGHNPVKKLDFLYDMPELRVLIVAICDVTDITPIASLKHLEYLEVFHNSVTDVSALADLEYLIDLNLVKNRISDLTPLYNLKNLKRLWIHLYDQNNPMAPDEKTLRELQEALPNCHIDPESTSTAGGWRLDPHYYAIVNMFKTRQYEPFEDSLPENMPEPWRTEAMKKTEQDGERGSGEE